jgi:hypothetical protein
LDLEGRPLREAWEPHLQRGGIHLALEGQWRIIPSGVVMFPCASWRLVTTLDLTGIVLVNSWNFEHAHCILKRSFSPAIYMINKNGCVCNRTVCFTSYGWLPLCC